MNAKYVGNIWEVGGAGEAGQCQISGIEEVASCIKEVMQGERREIYRRNAHKWSDKA